VISAMGEGRLAASAMHEYLMEGVKKIIPPSPSGE
jgi:glutamate synthase (NADPH/NADH) small chain